MQFFILGCGTIIPQKICSRCSGYLVDRIMLIDCGPGIWHALCKEQIRITDLKYILISHFHVDHISDLGALLSNRYMLREESIGGLQIIGPVGLLDWFNRYTILLGDWVNDLGIEIREITDSFRLQEYEIRSGKTAHTENSLCYRVTDREGKILFYSGDSGYHQDLIPLARGADLAVIETSYDEATPSAGHLTPLLAAEIAQQAGVKRMLLTHRYPDVTDSSALSRARKKYKGNVSLAVDGLKINL